MLFSIRGVAGGRRRLSDFTFTFHSHALEKEMATHSSVLAWRKSKVGGAWWAAVSWVAQSQTQLKRLSSSSRDIVKKIRDTKRTFHAEMGTIKDRNGMNLTESEDIKRWQEYTEELYKKDLHDPDNDDGVITHLEPDILQCEVKRALGSITTNKASRGDGIPAGLFQILKDDVVKVLHSISQKMWKTQQ